MKASHQSLALLFVHSLFHRSCFTMPLSIPSSMKCIVYGKDSRPVSKTVPVPDVVGSNKNNNYRAGHVLVQVHAAGLNPVDAKDVMGDKLPHSWTTVKSWLRSFISDKIPGFDFAGVVVCGENDKDAPPPHHFAAGDKVFGTMPPLCGTLAEYISVPIDQVCYMPSNLSFEEAAALPLVGLTALQALSPHVSTKTSVLVIGGSGGTGHVALQVARCLGATQIAAVCSAPNADFCRSCGATEIIEYSRSNSAHVLEGLMKSPSKPFAVVMDCVTSADPQGHSMKYPALLQDPKNAGLLTSNYIYRRLGGPTLDWIRAGLERTIGINWLWANQHEKLFWVRFPKSAGELRQLQEWAEAGKLRPHIAATHEFTEDGVKKAFDAILSRRVQGKVVIKVRLDESRE